MNQRNQVFGTGSYQRTSTDTTSLFGFNDRSRLPLMWRSTGSPCLAVRVFRTRYQFTRQSNTTTPFFANRTNVSGDAGITGNNQDPVNWGPPRLSFTTMAGLSDAVPLSNDTMTHAAGLEGYLFRGRHNFTVGGDIRRHYIDILSQQDPRGSFTGAATGFDFADFPPGTPSAARSPSAMRRFDFARSPTTHHRRLENRSAFTVTPVRGE